MSGPEAQALLDLYAGRLAHIYRRVAGETAAEAARAISTQAVELARKLASLPVSPTMETLLRSAASENTSADVAADLRARSMLLQQLADEARGGIEKEVVRLEAALRRYGTMLRSLQQYADGATYQNSALNASLDQYECDVRNRSVQLADRLSESRYDQANFRHLLVYELLDIAGLAQVMSSSAEVGHKKQQERWHSICSELGIVLSSEAPRSSFDLAVLAEAFLAAVQLVYERPGMLKSIAQALNRGKFQEKLATEVYAGLARMRPYIEDTIMQAWRSAEKQWSQIAQNAVEIWLEIETSTDKNGCEARLTDLQQKLVVIRSWQNQLQQLTPQNMLAGWAEPLRRQATTDVANRLMQEAQEHGQSRNLI